MALMALGAALLPCILVAQVPSIVEIPPGLPELLNQRLTQSRQSLVAYRDKLVQKAKDHNGKCVAVEKATPLWTVCNDEQADLEGQRRQYIDAVNKFNSEVARAVPEQKKSPPPAGVPVATPGPQIGAAAAYRGGVFIITPGGNKFPIQQGTPIQANAHIMTGPDGRLQVLLADETTFTLGPNSDMVLDEFVYDPKTNAGKITANLSRGTFRFVTGKMAHQDPAGIRVKLAVGDLGFRGTDVESEVSPDGSGYVKLFVGHVEIDEYKTGTLLLLNPGEIVTFTADGTFSSVMKFP